jgi:hypothetical protein
MGAAAFRASVRTTVATATVLTLLRRLYVAHGRPYEEIH